MNNDKNRVLVSVATLVRVKDGVMDWFLTKNPGDPKWELPKVVVRKGESSVRAALRIMGEKGAMTTRVLEEAGRSGGATVVGGKSVPQRSLYYLMLYKSSAGEPIGFGETEWVSLATGIKHLASKREQRMLKQAKETYAQWKKAREERRKKK